MSIASEHLEDKIDELREELKQWKEAARSEAQMLNEELERSKILIEALEMISEICYYHDYGDHRAVATRAIEKYRGED
jgi:hypothetical protein